MSLVELDLTDHIATVTLNDPGRRNALSTAMVAELCATFDAFEAASGIRAVVITAEPPAFCAGADLSGLRAAGDSSDAAQRVLAEIYEGFLRVARCPLPTIAAIDGAAVGAGMNLALACDVRIAGPNARFDPRFVQLGLHPGGGHTWLLQRLVGPQTATAAVVFGETFNATAALRAGLVYEVAESADLATRARELASRAAASDRELLMKVKATMADVRSLDVLDDAVARELGPQVWSITQPGVAAKIGIKDSPIGSTGAGNGQADKSGSGKARPRPPAAKRS